MMVLIITPTMATIESWASANPAEATMLPAILIIPEGCGFLPLRPGGTVEWMFDLSGNALTASVPGTTQFYGAEYFVGGRDWGTLSTGGVNFRYPDWVGNGRVWQDVAGTVTQQAAFGPFGDGLFAPRGGSCCSLQAGMFDSAWQDSANNTYHTLNREYSPAQGRWLTPDPAGMAAVDPTNPQSWNRYAYVTNNPVSFTDPTGLGDPGGAPAGPWSSAP